MTEFAMGVSNPLIGVRKLNSVGKPLPGYEIRLSAEPGVPTAPPTGFIEAGEIQIRGAGVFSEYWGKPEATSETFDSDGWFKTGDMGACDSDGYLFILGRLSADIIKSGGFKISALDIERELLHHSSIAEIAVLGIKCPTYGEKIAAVIVPKAETEEAVIATTARLQDPQALAAYQLELKEFLKDRLPPYKTPVVLKIVSHITRNAMGKINKKALRAELFPEAGVISTPPPVSPVPMTQ